MSIRVAVVTVNEAGARLGIDFNHDGNSILASVDDLLLESGPDVMNEELVQVTPPSSLETALNDLYEINGNHGYKGGNSAVIIVSGEDSTIKGAIQHNYNTTATAFLVS